MSDPKRRTGRTTRMMEEACRLANEGKVVFVVASQAKQLEREYRNPLIRFHDFIPHDFDFLTMRIPHAHNDCVWLVDHFVVESLPIYRAMHRQVTRFDDGVCGVLTGLPCHSFGRDAETE